MGPYPIDDKCLMSVLVWLIFTQGAMQEAWWDQVHNQRLPLLQPSSDQQRRGCRGCCAHLREGHPNRLDADE